MKLDLIEEYNIELVNLNLERLKRKINDESVQFRINIATNNVQWLDEENNICEIFIEVNLSALDGDVDEETVEDEDNNTNREYCNLSMIVNVLVKSKLKKDETDEESIVELMVLLAQPTIRELVNQNLYRVGLPGADIPWGNR